MIIKHRHSSFEEIISLSSKSNFIVLEKILHVKKIELFRKIH